jgi:adenylate cyclase
MPGRRHAGRLTLAAIGLLAGLLALVAHTSGVLDRVEAQSVDARFAQRGTTSVPNVAVVDIDAESITRLGTWPIRRTHHADAIDALRRAGARTVAYDVQFTEASERVEDDVALFEAVARAPGAVLSTTEVLEDGTTRVLGGPELLAEARAVAANTTVPVGLGGVVRNVRAELDGLKTFPVAAVESATGRPVRSAALRGEGAPIDYHGRAGTIPTYQFVDLLDGRIPAEKLRGHIVVVGSSAPSLQDLHPVPTQSDGLMPGPEIQANAISTVLRGMPLRDAPGWIGALAAFVLALVVPLAALRIRPLGVAALGVLFLAGWIAACVVAFHRGLILVATEPLLALSLSVVGTLGAEALFNARERRRVRSLFGRFVPDSVVDELLEVADGSGGIAGKRQDATVLFCDLRGFTTFAEHAQPELVIEVLNTYLGEMTEAIQRHSGTVVSYQGDGIMAVFGAPVARDDHAASAVDAAQELLELRLGRLNLWLAERDLPPFRLGVGLNSGAVMSGTVGSERRMEYAAVGDTTNVAARLQAATKGTPFALFVSQTTWDRMPGRGRGRLIPAGELAVKGRETPVPVWSLPSATTAEPLRAAS